MTYKIKKMINNGTEYKIGSIDSSNDTYENIIHLSQADYDALETKDPDTLYSTPESESPGTFNPENEGTIGQVLTKTETGYAYCDLPKDGKCIDLLVIAGGGGGGRADGGNCGGGGGGAGGFFESGCYKIDSDSISISIGSGGAVGASRSANGCKGGNSSFGSLIMEGGGYGGGAGKAGGDGGSGGGAGGVDFCAANIGGISFGYGNQGGGAAGGGYRGGGGGGAGGQGGYGTYCNTYQLGGQAGQGCFSKFFCPGCIFANGGWGKHNCCGPTGYLACKFYGAGGDGDGGYTGNTGNGCQGVAMLRYPTDGSYGIISSTGGDCCFTCDGYCYVEFTQDGTFCIEC